MITAAAGAVGEDGAHGHGAHGHGAHGHGAHGYGAHVLKLLMNRINKMSLPVPRTVVNLLLMVV